MFNVGIDDLVVKPKETVVKDNSFFSETIHPTQKFTSMNLLQMSCVMT